MRIEEDRHPGEPWLLWRMGNLTALDPERVRSVGVAWGFREGGRWCWWPRVTGSVALYYNAILFVRYTVTPITLALLLAATFTHAWWLLCFGLFAHLRWSGSATRKAFIQLGAGYKLNGRLGLIARVQSDATAARGVTGPNTGQSTGFDYGTH